MGTNTGHIKIVKCRVREYNYIYAYSKKVTPNATIYRNAEPETDYCFTILNRLLV